MKTFKFVAISVLLGIVAFGQQAQPPASSVVPLVWSKNQEKDLREYRVYWGDQPGRYTHLMQVPLSDQPSATATIVGGTNWFFVVTAVNTSGLESIPSNELRFTQPDPSTRPTSPSGFALLSATTTITSVTTVSNVVVVPHHP